jgi:hypothetical protein
VSIPLIISTYHKSFFYNLFTKGTDKIQCRYKAPREEPREAHGYLSLNCDGYMVALSVDSCIARTCKLELNPALGKGRMEEREGGGLKHCLRL